jgi:hypothetical protein
MRASRLWLIAAALLFTSATEARAECAWVLWGRIIGDPIMSAKGWFIRGSFDRRAECTNAYTIYLSNQQGLGWEVIGGQDTVTGQGAVITAPSSMTDLSNYRENVVCRPDSVPPTKGGVLGDTVDPRGPKGR